MAPKLNTEGHEWNTMAKKYKSLTTGVGVKPVASIVQHANALLPFSEATAILDNGCGPGPVTARIIQDHGHEIPENAMLTAADFSQGMIDALRNEQASHKGDACWDRLQTRVLDATDLSELADDSLSHITAGWVYFMTSDPLKCLTENHRTLKKGGALAISSWQANAWMSVMMAAAKAKPSVGATFPDIPEEWKTVEGISGELRKAGFTEVGGEEVHVTMEVQSREGMVDFFMTDMPHVKRALQEYTDSEKAQAREFMLEEMVRLCPTEPGTLTGVSVVAWARK